MPTKPYRLKLKKVSRAEQQLLASIYGWLPATGMRSQLAEGLRETISRHVGEGFALRLEAVEQRPYSLFLERMPAKPLLAVVGLPPTESRIVCEIDATLAMMAVERMLGGYVESMPEPRELSETEQGVLQYLLVEILAHLHRASGSDARVHFRFDRFAQGVDDVRGLAAPESSAASLAFRITIGRHAGFVRLLFPEPFVDEVFRTAEVPEELTPAEREIELAAMHQYDYIRVPLWAEAGRMTLAPSDLTQIEEGDILLLEQGDLALAGGGALGRVVLRAGNGLNGGLDAEVSLDARRAHCRIEGMHKGA